jgi:hypothetical protein
MIMDENRKTTGNGLIALTVISLVVALLALGGIGASIYMNLSLRKEMNEQYAKVSQFIDDEKAKEAEELEQTSDYQEDGYKVGGTYEIISTTQISDAYLNGDTSELSDNDLETYNEAVAVLDQIITDGMSSYEKELAIYDWMVDNIGHGNSTTITLPGSSSESYTPHDVLKYKNAVCVGYATTFRLLANMVGLDVHIVHNEYHSWDMVQLDDGEWYQLDIYSDADYAKYRHFNMTDEEAATSYTWDSSSLPSANGTKYSYAVQNAESISDLYEVPEKLKAALDENSSGALYFKFPDKLTDSDFALADQMFSLLQEAVYMLTSYGTELSASWVPDGENGGYVLALYYTDYNSSTSSPVLDADSDQVTEMADKINEVFETELMYTDESSTKTWFEDGTQNKFDQSLTDDNIDGPTTTITVG